MSSQFIKAFLAPIFLHRMTTLKSIISGMLFGLFAVFGIIMIRLITLALERGDTEGMQTSVVIFSLATIGYYILWYIFRHASWPNAVHIYENTLFDIYIPKYIHASPSEIEKIGSGKMLTILNEGLEKWAESLASLTSHIPEYILLLVFIFVFVGSFGGYYLVAVIITLSLIVGSGIYFNKKSIPVRQLRYEHELTMSRHLIKILMSKMEVLLSGKMHEEIMHIKRINDKHLVAERLLGEILFWMFASPHIIFGATKILLYGLSAYTVIFSTNTSILISLLVMIAFLEGLTFDVVRYFKDMLKQIAKVAKVYDTLESMPALRSINEGEICLLGSGGYRIDCIDFGYDDRMIFSNFSLDIKGGSKVALVGPSGSGKTTLLKLLAYALLPTSGKILCDGQDINNVQLGEYFGHIGYLPQEPAVFDGSIYDNLIYSCNGDAPSYDQLITALKNAECDFVFDLPEGMDTQIGERGVRLSGGQKQRIAIAKIWLKNPAIILLDEPTSALDSLSEHKISQSLEKLFVGKTVIVIAHRLQTVHRSDEILYMENGEILERGTHESLSKKSGGKYREMLDLQSGF